MEKFRITLNGQSYEVEVERLSSTAGAQPAAPSASMPATARNGIAAPVSAPAVAAKQTSSNSVSAGAKTLAAPMPGKVVAVNFTTGAFVKKGQVVLILEAMKMQNEILAPEDGQIVDVRVQAGQTVRSGEPLVIFS